MMRTIVTRERPADIVPLVFFYYVYSLWPFLSACLTFSNCTFWFNTAMALDKHYFSQAAFEETNNSLFHVTLDLIIIMDFMTISGI